jgi:hypothetical protein
MMSFPRCPNLGGSKSLAIGPKLGVSFYRPEPWIATSVAAVLNAGPSESFGIGGSMIVALASPRVATSLDVGLEKIERLMSEASA